MQLFLKTTCFVKDKKLNRNGRFKNDRFRSVGYTSRNLKQNNLLKKRVVKTIVFESQKNHLKKTLQTLTYQKKHLQISRQYSFLINFALKILIKTSFFG